ncbi:MAG: hypothetical protein DYG98_18585 [Haliscomenobacteraceae bacterium CHB4]|nr:hypothetical protein [Haliscomenobacteraceae bacterium CHB4]
MAKKVLFIGGSLNQTTMMWRIATELPECDCWFSSYYADGPVRYLAERGLLDFTILGGGAVRAADAFFIEKQLRVDYRGERNEYDLVVTCSDLIVPENIRKKPVILVQEGMMTPENLVYQIVRNLGLPRYLGNTSMTGLSHAYQKFCVASEGFREMFIRKGVGPERIEVTGIPNFDDLGRYASNNFPHRDFVLGATSCLRESFQYENRPAFIRKVLEVAEGRPVVFKLHPNENHTRALREIGHYAPGAVTFTTGNINPMIANCTAMVTKYSSVMLVALGMGKPVYSDIEPALAESLRPVQNGGTSAKRIADICRVYL